MSVRIMYYHEFPDDKYVLRGDDNGGKVPYLGTEIEIDKGSDNNKAIHAVNEIMGDFIHFEEDCSLDEGFENITQPATLEYHMGLQDKYHEMFKILVHMGYRAHNTNTCGLHVHFNRRFFKDNEDLYVTRLLFFVEKFWDELTKFSRRNINKLNSWAKKPDGNIKKVVEDNKRHCGDRYSAINLTNRDTIEFRIFRGTLNFNTYIATLQLVNNMVIMAREVREENLQKITWEDFLTTPELKAYWETVKDRTVK